MGKLLILTCGQIVLLVVAVTAESIENPYCPEIFCLAYPPTKKVS
jgi:hypothetical protein